MTAPARREDVAAPLEEAAAIRREWLAHGRSTEPADRPIVEYSLTAIYARISRPRPRFVWVDSPNQALPYVTGLPTLAELYARVRDPRPRGKPPLASDLAMAGSRLRSRLDAGVGTTGPRRRYPRDWRELPPEEALAGGVPLRLVLDQEVRQALHHDLADAVRTPIRDTLPGPVPVCWYGQQDAAWIGYYDALHRLGLARYGPDELGHLGHWAALARSGGWWWPGEQVCVVVDRPARIGRADVRYRDGWHPLLT